jgi:hypothetical protein
MDIRGTPPAPLVDALARAGTSPDGHRTNRIAAQMHGWRVATRGARGDVAACQLPDCIGTPVAMVRIIGIKSAKPDHVYGSRGGF